MYPIRVGEKTYWVVNGIVCTTLEAAQQLLGGK